MNLGKKIYLIDWQNTGSGLSKYPWANLDSSIEAANQRSAYDDIEDSINEIFHILPHVHISHTLLEI